MAGLRIHLRYRCIIGAGNRYAGCGFRGCPIGIGHHITNVYCRAFTISQAVEIAARRKLQLVVNNTDRTLTAYWIAITINDLHAVQTETGCITIDIRVIGQHVNCEGFILMTGLRIHIRYRCIIGTGNRYAGCGFRGRPISIGHHITYGNRRAFTISQAVEITARRKLQLVINNTDRTLTTQWITVAINDLYAIQTEAGRSIAVIRIDVVCQYVNHEGFIFMAGLRVHIRYRCIIGSSNCYAGRGFRGCPVSVGHHITHGDGRAFTLGQAVEITTRRKLQLVVNNAD